MRWSIDLILLAILLLCTWNGYKRGLVVGIGGILSFVVSLYAACLLSGTFSHEVVSAVRPFASGYMDRVISNDVAQAMGLDFTDQTPIEDRYSINDVITDNSAEAQEFAETTYRCLGIYETAAQQMAQEAVDSSASDKITLKQAVTDVLCNRIVYVIGIILCFCIILILLTFIGNIPNLDFRLPNLEMADEIGGAVTGLLKGILFCMFAAWALKFMGILIGPDTLASTLLGRLFIKIGFIAHFIGI